MFESPEDAHARDTDLSRHICTTMAGLNAVMNRGVSERTKVALTLAYTELAAERERITGRWA